MEAHTRILYRTSTRIHALVLMQSPIQPMPRNVTPRGEERQGPNHRATSDPKTQG